MLKTKETDIQRGKNVGCSAMKDEDIKLLKADQEKC